MNKSRILPIGFYDLGANEAKKNYEYTKRAIDHLIASDYQLIKTSMVEFVDNYFDEELTNVFKVIDPISRKNIFFRNDITLQIANYISSQSSSNYSKPLKLCYYGDVINLNSDELYCERQQTQVGCEIIGDNSLNSCYQVINDTLNILSGLDRLNITISLPDFLDIFLKETNNSSNFLLKDAIINKRISDVKKYANDYSFIVSEIILNNSDFFGLVKNLDKIFGAQDAKKGAGQELKKQLNIANELMVFLQKNFPNLSINFDLFGDNNFSYHNKIAFDIFANNFPYPIAKGGCYSIEGRDQIISAVGSTIYVNFLRKI